MELLSDKAYLHTFASDDESQLVPTMGHCHTSVCRIDGRCGASPLEIVSADELCSIGETSQRAGIQRHFVEPDATSLGIEFCSPVEFLDGLIHGHIDFSRFNGECDGLQRAFN